MKHLRLYEDNFHSNLDFDITKSTPIATYIRDFYNDLKISGVTAYLKKDSLNTISEIIIYDDSYNSSAKIKIHPAQVDIRGFFIDIVIEFLDINSLDQDKRAIVNLEGYENDPLYIFMITLGYDMEKIKENMRRYIYERIGFTFHPKLENITVKKYITNKNSLKFDL